MTGHRELSDVTRGTFGESWSGRQYGIYLTGDRYGDLHAEQRCRVLAEDPDLGELIPERFRAAAVAYCTTPVVEVRRGGWDPDAVELSQGGIGLLVLDGVLIRRVGISGRFGAEVLGPGDLLRPWQDEDSILRYTSGWRVVSPARLALLDADVAARLARFPALTGALAGRALNRARQLAVMMAIVHHPRVEVRIHALLWHLAARWGRVRRDGVYLPLRLSHSLIGDLIAAQRPSVTMGLRRLADRQLITPRDSGWLLCGAPPDELLELQDVDIAVDAAAAAGQQPKHHSLEDRDGPPGDLTPPVR